MSIAAAIADALVAEGPGGAVAVDGLGVFHVRARGPRGGGTGVLFTLAPEMRRALAADTLAREPGSPGTTLASLATERRPGSPGTTLASLATERRPGPASPAKTTSLGLDATELVEKIREAMLANLPWHDPDLGTFTHVITTPKTFSDPRTGEVIDVPPRPALAFQPSKSLKARLTEV